MESESESESEKEKEVGLRGKASERQKTDPGWKAARGSALAGWLGRSLAGWVAG